MGYFSTPHASIDGVGVNTTMICNDAATEIGEDTMEEEPDCE